MMTKTQNGTIKQVPVERLLHLYDLWDGIAADIISSEMITLEEAEMRRPRPDEEMALYHSPDCPTCHPATIEDASAEMAQAYQLYDNACDKAARAYSEYQQLTQLRQQYHDEQRTFIDFLKQKIVDIPPHTETLISVFVGGHNVLADELGKWTERRDRLQARIKQVETEYTIAFKTFCKASDARSRAFEGWNNLCKRYIELTTPPALCESTNHDPPGECFAQDEDDFWECKSCNKTYCLKEGAADQFPDLCDNCWDAKIAELATRGIHPAETRYEGYHGWMCDCKGYERWAMCSHLEEILKEERA